MFDVDRVSSLIEIDQRHTVDFRIHSGTMLAKRPEHVPNNISYLTQLRAFFKGCIKEDKSVQVSVVLSRFLGSLGVPCIYIRAPSIAVSLAFSIPSTQNFSTLVISFFSFSVRCNVHCKKTWNTSNKSEGRRTLLVPVFA